MARSRNLAGLRGLVSLGNESVLPGQGNSHRLGLLFPQPSTSFNIRKQESYCSFR